jgi:predicted nucleotidyltransferase
MGKDSTSRVEQLSKTVQGWCREQPVRLCVLFGSQASGCTHPDSDVDLAVWPQGAAAPRTQLRWLRELGTVLGEEVSLVVVTPDLDPVLGFEIARQGRLIFEREPGQWVHQRAQLWHAYNDSLPFRRAARERLREFAAEMRRDA